MSVDPREFFYIHALQNAVQHNSVPKAGTVLGMLMGNYPEFRPQAKEMSAILGDVLKEVMALSPEERVSKLKELAPELLEQKKEKKEKVRGLRDLKNVGENGVVMRFAPNPSGPLHLGHARAAYLNDYYVRKYGGRYVLRIEDTDPRRVEPENYGLLLEDAAWMDLKITETVYQSDRFEIYYEHGRKLIEQGSAYICTCDSESFRELKNSKKTCPCRSNSVEKNLKLWEDMLAGKYPEGTITVRLKTEIDHPDPAMRDFSIFRVVDTPPHPKIDAKVYPMMNLSVVVDDHLLGITHVIRGKDHIANTRRQGYIYEYFGWKQPEYLHYGRMSIGDVVLSTSAMKEGIKTKKYTGWDDIHLGTLKAIARRGIRPEAVRNITIDIGVGQSDIKFSWENLFAENKQIVDPESNRYFFVPNPVKCAVEDAPECTATIPKHPNDESKGVRHLEFKGSLVASKDDLQGCSFVRFKDLFNATIIPEGDSFRVIYAGTSLDEAREKKAPIIQWLPVNEGIRCNLLSPEGLIEGLCESSVISEESEIVQFERVGFARIDSVKESLITAYFAHR
ncbi:glutamate--tRNA ligase [Methanoplanus sp. FWC-SCC4]|uniref:Glutamate--tRNA ligase n=1 Tax=Methanochimaera problematica TaxID=2609417 RepID=A0AA97FBR7_9EURY|nr:glutamate--tRNA ligase [Methanoplanus sp. FWC-SCC4]WOF16505.1 glutamate--tRNA ligase [Methanoplanus sp. FWC-SCC4]